MEKRRSNSLTVAVGGCKVVCVVYKVARGVVDKNGKLQVVAGIVVCFIVGRRKV